MRPSAEVTVPAPFTATVNVRAVPKVAVTELSAVTPSVHGLFWPAHAPLHDAKADAVPGAAVSVTDVPAT